MLKSFKLFDFQFVWLKQTHKTQFRVVNVQCKSRSALDAHYALIASWLSCMLCCVCVSKRHGQRWVPLVSGHWPFHHNVITAKTMDLEIYCFWLIFQPLHAVYFYLYILLLVDVSKRWIWESDISASLPIIFHVFVSLDEYTLIGRKGITAGAGRRWNRFNLNDQKFVFYLLISDLRKYYCWPPCRVFIHLQCCRQEQTNE